jgi:hypothetical protein
LQLSKRTRFNIRSNLSVLQNRIGVPVSAIGSANEVIELIPAQKLIIDEPAQHVLAREYSCVNAAIWILITLALPLFARTLRPTEIALGALILCGGWALGTLIINRVSALNEMTPITRDGVALLVGSFLLYPVCSLPLADSYIQIVFPCLSLAVLAFSLYFRRPSFKLPNASEFLAVAAAFTLATLLSVGNGDLTRGLTRLPVILTESLSVQNFDADYLTSMIATMRHGTIASAIFEKGSPLAYQVLGGFPPSVFAAASGAPSQVALWGIWMPLLKMLGLLLIAEVARRFISPSVHSKVWLGALLIALFVFLQPLHPIYLLKGVSKDFIWPGIGWLWGGLELSTVAGIVWACLALAVAFPATPSRQPTRRELIFLGVVVATLLSVKVAIFFALGMFLTTIGLMRSMRRDLTLIYALAGAAPFAVIVYLWAFRGSMIETTFRFGYLPRYFAGLFRLNGDGPRVLIIGLIGGLALYALWGAIRWFGVAFLFWGLRGTNLTHPGQEAAVATVATLIGCSAVGAFLNIVMHRRNSINSVEQVTNHSFNLLQFPRAAFLMVSVFGVAGVLGWILSRRQGIFRNLSSGVVGLWCLLAALSLVKSNMQAPAVIDESWFKAVLHELESAHPKLMVIDPSLSYPGMLLTSADVGPFWVSQTHVNKTAAISHRWKVFLDALSDDPNRQASACHEMKAEGVDVLIATLETEPEIERFGHLCGFQRGPAHRWIWQARLTGNNDKLLARESRTHDHGRTSKGSVKNPEKIV